MRVESIPSASASKPLPIHIGSDTVAAKPMGVAENARYVLVEVNVVEGEVTVSGVEVVKICVAYVAPELEENGMIEVESAGDADEVDMCVAVSDKDVRYALEPVNKDMEELAGEVEAAPDEEEVREADKEDV